LAAEIPWFFARLRIIGYFSRWCLLVGPECHQKFRKGAPGGTVPLSATDANTDAAAPGADANADADAPSKAPRVVSQPGFIGENRYFFGFPVDFKASQRQAGIPVSNPISIGVQQV
jgi:hypothetical protein